MNCEFDCSISCIHATFGEDRKDVVGVCRMTNVEIECDGDVPDDMIREMQDKIFTHFAEKEYFTENSDWEKQAEHDISNYTGISNVNVDFE